MVHQLHLNFISPKEDVVLSVLEPGKGERITDATVKKETLKKAFYIFATVTVHYFFSLFKRFVYYRFF